MRGVTHTPAVAHALDALSSAPNYLFDSVHQVHMKSWYHNRVVLLGDAAWCMTLFSGMGASSGLRGGALLGEALRRHPKAIDQALSSWQAEMRPFIRKHAFSARIKQQLFVPSNALVKLLRSAILLTAGKRAAAAKAAPAPPA